MLAAAPLAAQTAAPTTTTTGQVLGYVAADSVKRTAVSSLSEMLTARIPGVQTFSRDGQVGVGAVAYVRGLSGDGPFSEPLLIVDGVKADGRVGPTVPGTTTRPGTSRLDDIDPSQIARVEVVTGPGAAIYGSGSANGVILVTTTQSDGGRPRLDLSAEGGVTTTSFRDGQSYYAWGSNGQCLTYERAAGQCTVDSITHFNPLLANNSAVTSPGYLQRYVASIGGGIAGNAIRYMVTGNYSDEMGTLDLNDGERAYYQSAYGAPAPPAVARPNAMDAAGVRGALIGTLGSVADLSVTLGYLGNHQRSTDANAFLMDAANSPGYQVGDGWGVEDGGHAADVFADRGRDNTNRLTGSVHGDWHPVPALKGFITAGIDQVNETQSGIETAPPAEFGGFTEVMQARGHTARGDVSGGVTVGGALARGISSHLTLGGEYTEDHFTQTDTAYLGGASSWTKVWVRTQIGSGYLQDALAVSDRLFVNVGVRADDIRIHPVLSTTTVNGFANAVLVPLPEVAPLFKLHGGYSTSSQAPNAELAAAQVLEGLDYFMPPRPTREQDVEAGASAGGWGGRLNADVTLYDRRTARAMLPQVVGYDGEVVGEVDVNGGVVQNRGIEGRLSARLIDQPAFGWDATVTASGNENRLAKYPYEAIGVLNGLALRPGYPVFGAWAYRYTYSNVNDNGAISPGEMSASETPAYMGSPVPTREASLQTGVRLFHHRLRLAALIDYRGGYVLPNVAGWLRAVVGTDPAINDLPSSLARQAQALAPTVDPLAYSGWWQHVEAFRWRELSATVTVQRFDVTVAARNLALWTNYRGEDPDTDLTGNGMVNNIQMQLPPPRTFLIKVATSI